VVGDALEIGRRLTDAKSKVGHGGWLPWLDREFGWKTRAAENFMAVHELAAKNANFANLSLPVSGLYLLAAPSTPDEARAKVIEQAKDGKALTLRAHALDQRLAVSKIVANENLAAATLVSDAVRILISSRLSLISANL
jgi:DUF3102 family protein